MTYTGIEMLKEFEGLKLAPYKDVAGKATVGYGHLILPGEDFSAGITAAKAEEILQIDVQHHEDGMLKLVSVPLKPWEKDALTSFCFNLGVGAFEGSTLRKMVNAGRTTDASDNFLRWTFAGGKQVGTLVRRRAAESVRYLGGSLELVKATYRR